MHLHKCQLILFSALFAFNQNGDNAGEQLNIHTHIYLYIYIYVYRLSEFAVRGHFKVSRRSGIIRGVLAKN